MNRKLLINVKYLPQLFGKYTFNKNAIIICFFTIDRFFLTIMEERFILQKIILWFLSLLNEKIELENRLERSSYRLMVRTLLFHSRNTGSNPVRNKFQFRIVLNLIY